MDKKFLLAVDDSIQSKDAVNSYRWGGAYFRRESLASLITG
jgi:hypothetical protein